jgi:hypothetical protein
MSSPNQNHQPRQENPANPLPEQKRVVEPADLTGKLIASNSDDSKIIAAEYRSSTGQVLSVPHEQSIMQHIHKLYESR